MPPTAEQTKKHEVLKDELAKAMSAINDYEISWILEGARAHLVDKLREERRELMEIERFGALVPRHHQRPVALETEPDKHNAEREIDSLERRLAFVDALLRLHDHEEDTRASASILAYMRSRK